MQFLARVANGIPQFCPVDNDLGRVSRVRDARRRAAPGLPRGALPAIRRPGRPGYARGSQRLLAALPAVRPAPRASGALLALGLHRSPGDARPMERPTPGNSPLPDLIWLGSCETYRSSSPLPMQEVQSMMTGLQCTWNKISMQHSLAAHGPTAMQPHSP